MQDILHNRDSQFISEKTQSKLNVLGNLVLKKLQKIHFKVKQLAQATQNLVSLVFVWVQSLRRSYIDRKLDLNGSYVEHRKTSSIESKLEANHIVFTIDSKNLGYSLNFNGFRASCVNSKNLESNHYTSKFINPPRHEETLDSNLYVTHNTILNHHKSVFSSIDTDFISKNTHSIVTLISHYAKNYDTLLRILLSLLCGFICSMMFYTAYANTPINSKAHTNTTSQDKTIQTQIQIKGDTLVIQDASCQPHNKTLLQSLQAKNTKNTTTLQECDDSSHK